MKGITLRLSCFHAAGVTTCRNIGRSVAARCVAFDVPWLSGLSLRTLLGGLRFDEVSDGLPRRTQLRLALANVVTQGDVTTHSMVQHALQCTAGNQLLGNARKGCAQTMPLN